MSRCVPKLPPAFRVVIPENVCPPFPEPIIRIAFGFQLAKLFGFASTDPQATYTAPALASVCVLPPSVNDAALLSTASVGLTAWSTLQL